MSATNQVIELTSEVIAQKKVIKTQARMLERLVSLVDIVLEGGSIDKADLAEEVVKYRRWRRKYERKSGV